MPLRIDVHHHYFPPDLNKRAASTAAGFRTPPEHLPWTPQISLDAMDTLDVDLAILSVPANYPSGLGAYERAQEANEAMVAVSISHPGRFAFWGCLGDWRDVDGALKLISHVLDDLKAVGIAVASCYGSSSEAQYIGDEVFEPIWAELDRRNAIIFLHGAQIAAATPMPHPALGIPITEAPHETFKAISHLIVSGITTRYPHLTFILAHMGGSTLALAPRVAALSAYMGAPFTPDAFLAEFRRCWWDTALSGTVAAASAFGVSERIVWGSDFPAVPLASIQWFDAKLEADIPGGQEKIDEIQHGNIMRLFTSRGISLKFPPRAQSV